MRNGVKQKDAHAEDFAKEFWPARPDLTPFGFGMASGPRQRGMIEGGGFTRKPVKSRINTGDFAHLTRKVIRKRP